MKTLDDELALKKMCNGHPRVTDIVEAATDVALKNPLWADLASTAVREMMSSVAATELLQRASGQSVSIE